MRSGNWSMLNSIQKKPWVLSVPHGSTGDWIFKTALENRTELIFWAIPYSCFHVSVVGIEAALMLLDSPVNPSLLEILLLNGYSLHLVLSGGVWPGLLQWSWLKLIFHQIWGRNSSVCGLGCKSWSRKLIMAEPLTPQAADPASLRFFLRQFIKNLTFKPGKLTY